MLRTLTQSRTEEGYDIIESIVTIAIIIAISIGGFMVFKAFSASLEAEDIKKTSKEEKDSEFVEDPEHVSSDEKFRK